MHPRVGETVIQTLHWAANPDGDQVILNCFRNAFVRVRIAALIWQT